jgi:hypothetical protein
MLSVIVLALAVLPRVEIGMGYIEPIGPAPKVDKIAIVVKPSVLMPGGTLVLTCHVPRDPDNRTLVYGVTGFRENLQRQIDGADAPITWRFEMPHVPCDVGPAYCATIKVSGAVDGVTARFNVACDDGSR